MKVKQRKINVNNISQLYTELNACIVNKLDRIVRQCIANTNTNCVPLTRFFGNDNRVRKNRCVPPTIFYGNDNRICRLRRDVLTTACRNTEIHWRKNRRIGQRRPRTLLELHSEAQQTGVQPLRRLQYCTNGLLSNHWIASRFNPGRILPRTMELHFLNNCLGNYDATSLAGQLDSQVECKVTENRAVLYKTFHVVMFIRLASAKPFSTSGIRFTLVPSVRVQFRLENSTDLKFVLLYRLYLKVIGIKKPNQQL